MWCESHLCDFSQSNVIIETNAGSHGIMNVMMIYFVSFQVYLFDFLSNFFVLNVVRSHEKKYSTSLSFQIPSLLVFRRILQWKNIYVLWCVDKVHAY